MAAVSVVVEPEAVPAGALEHVLADVEADLVARVALLALAWNERRIREMNI